MMLSDTRQHLRVKTVNGVTVVGFAAPEAVFQTKDVEEIDDELRRLFDDAGPHQLLLNLDGIRYLSSSLLGRLIHLNKTVIQSQGRFAVCCLTPVMRDTFRVSRLDRLFEIFDDEPGALAHF